MTALVYTNGERIALGASAISVHWIEEHPVFALGDGSVWAKTSKGSTRIVAYQGAILCAAVEPLGGRLVTGGDDGRLLAIDPVGAFETLANFGGKWINNVATSAASGLIAASVGKEVAIFEPQQGFAKGAEDHRFTYPSTVGGLAFDAKGKRLAASHYGGVTLRYALDAEDAGVLLAWAGSHLSVTMSPGGDYVISAMQENALHGWKIPEKTDLRMTGYSAKTRSFSWDKRGRWLATSGADVAVVWPFVGKLGPQGKEPLTLAPRGALVSAVAFHPTKELLAIGYADGAAVLTNFADQSIIELDEPGEGALTALAWSDDGAQIALGDEAGRGGIVRIA